MSKLLHSITLPDGTIATRESTTRRYTHAVVVITTAVERDRRVASSISVITACEEQIARLRAHVNDDDKIAYDKAVARIKYLEMDVREDLEPDEKVLNLGPHKPRWLSNEFGGINGRGSIALHDAQELRNATVTSKIARLEERVQTERTVYLAPAEVRAIGRSQVYRWSLTRKGAEQGLGEIHRNQPLDDMFITDLIVVAEQ